ncbi:hypothetical protein G6F68_020926 [Rhizopus microsporus]|nr:hypothetical protein G6F68_020926 [Rhizopus microsporus]
MAPGNARPISPLANTASAASTPVAIDMARNGRPASRRNAVSAAASTHSVIMLATSMSILANCAAPKNKGIRPRMATAHRACATVR